MRNLRFLRLQSEEELAPYMLANCASLAMIEADKLRGFGYILAWRRSPP